MFKLLYLVCCCLKEGCLQNWINYRFFVQLQLQAYTIDFSIAITFECKYENTITFI